MLKPFFTYFGGKYRAAPHYPAPIYESIVEPFAGAAGYAVRYYKRDVRLYDLDPVIAGLWKYLIKVDAREILSIPLDIAHVDDLTRHPQEARHLVGFWLNKGNARPCKTPSAWMRSGERPNSYWGAAVRDRIAKQVRLIKHWRVYNKSYADMTYCKEATYFVDPPYQQAGRSYACSAKQINFADLARWCRKRRGQVIVCENAGADWLPFKPFADIRGTPGRYRSATSREVIYLRHRPAVD